MITKAGQSFFQSTSRNKEVAIGFSFPENPEQNKVSVLLEI